MSKVRKKFKTKNKYLGIKSRQALVFYLCVVTLPVVQFCIFYIGVNAFSLKLAFQKFDPIAGKYVWNGLGHFKDFFVNIGTDPRFGYALKNSATLWLIAEGINLPCCLLISYYLFKKYLLHKVYRVFLFIPAMIPSIVLVTVFQYTLIHFFPTIGLPNYFLEDSTKFVAALIYGIWVGIPGSMLLYTSAMCGTSKEILEAAVMDGANEMQQLWHVVIPHIYPTVTIFFATSIPSLFNSSGSILEFFGGGAPKEATTMGYLLTLHTLSGDVGYPITIAYGLIITSISLPIVIILRKLFRKYGPSED